MKRQRTILYVLLTLAFSLSLWICASAVYAEAGSVQVYISISKDGDFVTGCDGTVMAHVPIDVKYVDLKEYGLERFYRYEAAEFEDGGQYVSDKIVEKPTALHCFIQALGQYYVGRPLTSSDIQTEALTVTGNATSLYMTRFWGHNYNLMYFVNHAYPLMAPGLGSTCDYILLNDEDTIDLAMYTDEDFRFKGAFYSFDHEEATIDSGDELTLTLTGVPTQGSINGETIPPKAITGEPVKVSADKGVSWTVTESVTDQNGQVTVDFDKAGTYYVSCGNSGENYDHIAPPICVVTVKEEGVDPGMTPDPTQDTDEQHTAEEEAQKKAEEEAQKKAEEEAQKKAEEEAQKKAEEERAKAEEAEKNEQNKRTNRWSRIKSRMIRPVRSAVSNIGKSVQKAGKYVVKAGARVRQAVRAWIRGKK